jgi:phosphoglycolate phosphatase
MLADFDAVVFDWDGTLIDSTPTIARSIQAAAADLGLPVPDFELASHVIGLGLQDALARAVPTLPAARAAEFSARYRVHYLAQDHMLQLFAGARELVEALSGRGMPLAIATGKSRVGLERSLQATGLGRYFDAFRCADQTHSKPHPAMLLELADELALSPARLLMIGDTTHDLEMAAAAGAKAVGMTHGAHDVTALQRLAPLALFDSIADLHRWLLPEL